MQVLFTKNLLLITKNTKITVMQRSSWWEKQGDKILLVPSSCLQWYQQLPSAQVFFLDCPQCGAKPVMKDK